MQYINIKDYENAFKILIKVLANLDDIDFNIFCESFKQFKIYILKIEIIIYYYLTNIKEYG